MAHRDFDAEAAERARAREPDTFKLGGRTFTLRPSIPLGAMMDLAGAPNEWDDIEGALLAFVAFFEAVVADEDREHVAEAVRSVDFHQRHDITRWIGETYAGRPTQPSSDSAVSPLPDGRDSSSEPSDTATAA